jgi:hypothetical protein
VFENRLIAVGTSAQQAAVWMSSDGLSWSRLPNTPDLANDSTNLEDVVAGGPGLVAVGSARTEEGGTDAAVWTSTDGVTWSRIPHDAAVFGGSGNEGIRAIAAGPEGLVAVGYNHAYSEGAVWTSIDGIEWSRAPHNAELFGYPSFRSLEDVVAFNGGFVAVGSVWSDGSLRAAVWLSPDGLAWSRIVTPTEGEMRGLTTEDGSLIAVGRQTTGVAAWSSDDGIEWMRVRDADFGGPGTFDLGYSEMRAVLAAAGGLIAVGSIQEAGSSDGAVWRSTDGISWSRDESAALGGRWYQDLFAAAEFAGGIAVVGTDSVESEGPFAAAWYIGPSTAVVPTTTTTIAPLPTTVTPGAPNFVMRCGDIVRPYESPPPITYPNCAWVAWADPLWSVGRWELDPDNPPDPASSSLTVLARETGCIGRSPPHGLEIRPIIMISGDEIVVFVLIEARVYPANCSGPNPKFPVTIDLGAPLGNRRVFEGKLVPPILRFPEA